MTLAALQHALAGHIHGRPSDIATALADTRGLAVYRHAYRATLRGALRDVFARTATWLGDKAFDTLADDYVAATPSASWTLSDYGERFGDLLAAAYPDDPEVAELAWLEWQMRRAFDAADAATVDRSTLHEIDWEHATIGFAPAVAARRITTDLPAIWHALDHDRAPDGILPTAPLGLVVWRAGLEPHFRSTDPLEADAIIALAAGATFGTACAQAATTGADPTRVGGWLSQWLADGLVVTIGNGGPIGA